MINERTVVEVCEAEYAEQYLRALGSAIEELDEILDELPEESGSNGFAAVVDKIEDYEEELRSTPGWAMKLLMNRLAGWPGARPHDTALTKQGAWELIEGLVNSVRCDAFEDAALRGRHAILALPTIDWTGAAEAVARLERLLSDERETVYPISLRYGTQLAMSWFTTIGDQEEHSHGETAPTFQLTPENFIEGLMNAAVHFGLKDDEPEDQGRLIAEFRASFCPPVGKPLAYGKIGVVEDKRELRTAVFLADDHNLVGGPVGEVLQFPIGAKAKMGGRIDLAQGFYVIVAGGKSAARQLLASLSLSR